MAISGNFLTLPGVVASATLAASQYKAVKMASTAGQVKVCSAATDVCIGLVQNDPAAGEPALVAGFGYPLAVLAASVTVGAHLAPNTTGQLAITTTDNDMACAIAIEASSSAGEIHPVHFTGAWKYS